MNLHDLYPKNNDTIEILEIKKSHLESWKKSLYSLDENDIKCLFLLKEKDNKFVNADFILEEEYYDFILKLIQQEIDKLKAKENKTKKEIHKKQKRKIKRLENQYKITITKDDIFCFSKNLNEDFLYIKPIDKIINSNGRIHPERKGVINFGNRKLKKDKIYEYLKPIDDNKYIKLMNES